MNVVRDLCCGWGGFVFVFFIVCGVLNNFYDDGYERENDDVGNGEGKVFLYCGNGVEKVI